MRTCWVQPVGLLQLLRQQRCPRHLGTASHEGETDHLDLKQYETDQLYSGLENERSTICVCSYPGRHIIATALAYPLVGGKLLTPRAMRTEMTLDGMQRVFSKELHGAHKAWAL